MTHIQGMIVLNTLHCVNVKTCFSIVDQNSVRSHVMNLRIALGYGAETGISRLEENAEKQLTGILKS